MRVKDALGRFGEDVAARHLEASGWDIVERNWRCESGELDLVALEDGVLVVVEVKTRRSVAYGHPFEAITEAKLARLHRLTGRWLEEHDVGVSSVRIDVVGVLVDGRSAPVVEHLRGVA